MSLDRHINTGWRQFFCSELGEFIDVVPPQQRIDEQWYQGTADAVYQNIRIDEQWYQGTADAVYQNIYAIEQERPNHVLIPRSNKSDRTMF